MRYYTILIRKLTLKKLQNFMTTNTFTPKNKNPLTIGIIGLGSIGCLIASQLPPSIQRWALLRNDDSFFHFAIESEHETTQYALPALQTAEIEGLYLNDNATNTLDLVLICCKASQTLNALKQWKSIVSTNTQLVILQNGFGQHDLVHQMFPNNSLYAASTTEGANRLNRHHIRHAGKGITQWGYYAGPEQALKLDISTLKGTHQAQSNIQQILLDKLAINAAINPLTVKYDCLNGDLLTIEAALLDLENICDEIEACYKTLGWTLSFSLFDRAQEVAFKTANNISSMLQDIRNSLETEIDYINDYLVRKANSLNLLLPLNKQLVDLVKQKETISS